ncbi:hypothetical protein NL108_017441 [Boleophthalmus pectinirostris]|nr:hypothetical protein NL108_017441 [Boleophthalmus pectinirostris]
MNETQTWTETHVTHTQQTAPSSGHTLNYKSSSSFPHGLFKGTQQNTSSTLPQSQEETVPRADHRGRSLLDSHEHAVLFLCNTTTISNSTNDPPELLPNAGIFTLFFFFSNLH